MLPAGAPSLFTRSCARFSRVLLWAAVVLLIGIILCVQWQVIGRYIFNDSPTWAEALAMLLVLYVTAFGAAVGVRDGSHVGFETVAQLLPPAGQRALLVVSHALVAVFGLVMAWSGWVWASGKWTEVKPMLGVPDALDYVPLVIAGLLIALFSLEHVLCTLAGTEVEPAWN